jgi:WD40 repeat protein
VWDFEQGAQLRTLKGHDKPVEAVAVTPDGRYAVSSSADRMLRVWDLELGEEVQAFTMEGHSGHVIALAVTPDGGHAVSGSNFGCLIVWDLEGAKEPRDLWERHIGWVFAVAVTHDGRYAVSGAGDRTLKLWDLERGVVVRTLKGHKDSVLAVAVTRDGRYAVSGSRDTTLRLWDLKRGDPTLIDRLKQGKLVQWVLSYIDAGWHLFEWHLLPLFGIERWPSALIRNRALRTLEGHTDEVNAVAVTPDGRYAVSASEDESLKVWDLERGISVATWVGETGRFSACTLASDGATVVAGDESGYVHFLRLEGVESAAAQLAAE